MQSTEQLFIGIDGGGTKCRAVISNAKGDILGQGLGGPANPFYGVERAINSIVEASEKAVLDAGLSVESLSDIVAGVGLAGVNLPSLYDEINNWPHPFSQLFLTTDMDIANCGANNGQEGGIIIVGTGSCGYINSLGKIQMFGGYGFPIGDNASGAWMGLKAIEHTLLVVDGYFEKGIMSKKILEHYSVNTGIELSEKLIGKASTHYAEIASMVFNCADEGDQVAIDIVNEGIKYITILAEKMIEKGVARLAMIGGLSKYILPKLNPKAASYFSYAVKQPEVGAVIFAMNQWKQLMYKTA